MRPTRSRLKKPLDQVAQDYTASIGYDRRLYKYDIAGSVAHARMLARQGIISAKDAENIVVGLVSIREEIEQGRFPFREDLEDIHMNIEARLFEKIGDVAGKLHTARSRNDQVALDMRLFVKDAVQETVKRLRRFQQAILDQAEANKDIVIPGYTHLQRAQPVLLAHHLLAYFEMVQRDVGRFQDCVKRADVMPLGSGALAGVPYPIDRESVARELGFSRISANSMDAVSDRDFVVEFHAAASLAMMHLSRMAEELILWSSEEFGFIEMDEAHTTGSSIMPQKKNPDVAELGRGRTGRVYGHLMATLTMLKGLPLSYNRDLQEDKEALFDTVDTLHSTLDAFSGMLSGLKANAARTRQATEAGYMLATDIADYLTKKGRPFREAHRIVGEIVQYAIREKKTLSDLTPAEYHRFSPQFGEDICSITIEGAIAARAIPGGTAPSEVAKALAAARKALGGEDA